MCQKRKHNNSENQTGDVIIEAQVQGYTKATPSQVEDFTQKSQEYITGNN